MSNACGPASAWFLTIWTEPLERIQEDGVSGDDAAQTRDRRRHHERHACDDTEQAPQAAHQARLCTSRHHQHVARPGGDRGGESEDEKGDEFRVRHGLQRAEGGCRWYMRHAEPTRENANFAKYESARYRPPNGTSKPCRANPSVVLLQRQWTGMSRSTARGAVLGGR